MTYPQYQQSQGYAPTAPYQQASPAPQQPTSGAALPQPVPGLAIGGVAGGGAWPNMRHLQGCTLIFEPIKVDETKTTIVTEGGVKKVVPAPEAYFHLTVVDSPTGKIQYGDSLDDDDSKKRPNVWERDTPCRFTNVNSNRYGPLNEVRNALAAGEPARVGVVERGTQGNRPYMVTKPDKMVGGADRPDGTERFERASQVWAAVFTKTFTNPEPRSLLAAPAQLPQQVVYGQPTAAPTQPYPYGAGAQPLAQQQPYAQPVPTAIYQQGAPAFGYAPASAPTYMYPPSGTGGTAGQPLAQQPASAPPAPTQPYNPAFDAWIASLPVEQQAGARAQYAPQQGPGI